jgi:UDP-N-acetylglucosamine/UDP-N-acetylgalactosamine diphosphorylase
LSKLNIKDSLDHFKSANELQAMQDEKLFSPVSAVVNTNGLDNDRKTNYHQVGLTAIKEGKVGAVILSGGQGTRLGFNGPKGMYNIGLISGKSIFQIHLERIMKLRKLAADSSNKLPDLPVYIMTSDLNHEIIKDYFLRQNYFGYERDLIVFFEQGLEPCFTFDGKMIVESQTSLSLAPDGNGGIYRALQQSGSINDMVARGIEHLHVYGIDNVLTKSLDPLFLGICIESAVECGNKVVWRAHKSEKVGVTAEWNGRMHIIEYSEIPPELAETEDASGKLVFGAANICNHYMSVKFLTDVALPKISGIYHLANKKIPYYDQVTQKTISPSKPNGVKLEMFIFDVFPLAEKWIAVEGLREEEFAPVKNEPGNSQDSPDTARAMLTAQSIKWLKDAGANVVSDNSESLHQCEISPLLSYGGEGLSQFSGQTIVLPTYLS